MEHNRELELAWEYAEHTGVSIFLTGKAGTGKTTFLRTLCSKSAKSIVVVAPTGVAAINAGGVTIHSFFQLPLSPYVPGSTYRDQYGFSRDKLRIIRSLDLLVIDEISMVRSDLLDAIDNALRKYRRNGRPFGGVQLLMIGDLQQLSPVVTPQDEAMLRGYYSTPYFFGSKALQQIPYVTIALTKVYRQQNERFVGLLNDVRDDRLTPDDMALLQSRLIPTFRPAPESGYIRLNTHNHSADSYNASELSRLKNTPFTYRAEVKGTFPEYSYPTADKLVLKKGAQVMFVKNDSTPEKRYYNGKVGHVVYADPGCVKVLCPGETEPITVVPQQWENARYTINEITNKVETEVQGTFSQLPLRLAWAITIHKSQGLTFDKVIIDAGASFAPGQVYVALSRCKTLEGIVLVTPISTRLLGADPAVKEYILHQDEEAACSNVRLGNIKKEYNRQLIIELFSFSGITGLQESLARNLGQTFSHSFPKETATQQEISVALREKVIEIADKWITLLSNMSSEALTEETLLERVRKSAAYFSGELQSIFGGSLKEVARVRTDNKKASQRVKELVADLRQELDKELFLLDAISREGFSIPGYLRMKQKAMLGSARGNALKQVAKGESLGRHKKTQTKAASEAPRTPKPAKAPKEKPEPSHLKSLTMFQKGMTCDEIARVRGLVKSTVTGHLLKCVEAGALTLEDAFTPLKVNAVASAMAKAGNDATFADLRAMLPEEIEDSDIYNIVRGLRDRAEVE